MADSAVVDQPPRKVEAPPKNKGPGFNLWPYVAREQSGAALSILLIVVQWVGIWPTGDGVFRDFMVVAAGAILVWYPIAQRNAVNHAANQSGLGDNNQVTKDFIFSGLTLVTILVMAIVSGFGLYLKHNGAISPFFAERMILSWPMIAFMFFIGVESIEDLITNGALNVQLKGLEGAFRRFEE